MKVWVTKYALTEGIQELDVRDCGNGLVERNHNYFHGEGRDWHKTRESAIARAEIVRTKKIEAVKKQLKRLEAMAF